MFEITNLLMVVKKVDMVVEEEVVIVVVVVVAEASKTTGEGITKSVLTAADHITTKLGHLRRKRSVMTGQDLGTAARMQSGRWRLPPFHGPPAAGGLGHHPPAQVQRVQDPDLDLGRVVVPDQDMTKSKKSIETMISM